MGVGAADRPPCGVDPGRQLITLVRKGSREVGVAGVDGCVQWLRLHLVQIAGLMPRGSVAAAEVHAAKAVSAVDLGRRIVSARRHPLMYIDFRLR
jgi:hypothetical protein